MWRKQQNENKKNENKKRKRNLMQAAATAHET